METNPFAYAFYAIWYVIVAWWALPWQWQLMSVVTVVVWFLVTTFQEAGPLRVASLGRRFSWLGYIALALSYLWVWMAIVPYIIHIPYLSIFIIGLFTIDIYALVWYVLKVVRRGHEDGHCWLRAYRRMRFRLRWDSIAKSCRLAHMHDARPKDWTTGGTTITVVGLRVQWVATLWHGRRSPSGTATDYLVRPARGHTVATIQSALDAVAVAALAHSVTLDESDRLNWWKLTVYWADPAEIRPNLHDFIDANSWEKVDA